METEYSMSVCLYVCRLYSLVDSSIILPLFLFKILFSLFFIIIFNRFFCFYWCFLWSVREVHRHLYHLTLHCLWQKVTFSNICYAQASASFFQIWINHFFKLKIKNLKQKVNGKSKENFQLNLLPFSFITNPFLIVAS